MELSFGTLENFNIANKGLWGNSISAQTQLQQYKRELNITCENMHKFVEEDDGLYLAVQATSNPLKFLTPSITWNENHLNLYVLEIDQIITRNRLLCKKDVT